MANNYTIPKGLTRKDRRHHLRKLKGMVKSLKPRWDRLEKWAKKLSEEEFEKAVNFQHEDQSINKEMKALADTEQTMIYYLKLIKKLENYDTKKPYIKNATTEEIPTLRVSR